MTYILQNEGYCSLCERRTIFRSVDENFRSNYKCSCDSPVGPRQRAIMHMLKLLRPNYKELAVHESSPGPWSKWIEAGAQEYIASHYFQDVKLGEYKGGFQCQDLENQTFGDCRFDVVITQDVMEHVLDPARAFREIARTLKPGGIHIFTTPILLEKTIYRARRLDDGSIEYLLPQLYHGNPIDKSGSLVTVYWGKDICDLVNQWAGTPTVAYSVESKFLGIIPPYQEVLVSLKF